MRGNQLIFSRSGDRRKLYGVSPLLFPQQLLNNQYFLPTEHELPQEGMTLRMVVFDFGFSDPSLVVPPTDSQRVSVEMGSNFLAEAFTGAAMVVGSATVPAVGSLANINTSPSYLFNIQHTHLGITRQWFNKDVPDTEALGTGQEPNMLFKHPPLIPAGDTLTCVVRNVANSNLRVQILLLGAQF